MNRPASKPVVVITGASAGVGRAVAQVFARKGWRVALVARGLARLEATAEDVRRLGGEALVFPADVADAGAVNDVSDKVQAAWGGIDVWINNAMVTVFGPVSSINPDEFRRVTDVTYLGQVHGTQAALRHMRRQGHGTIVCVGSALSYRSIPLQSAYCGAKAAVRGFVDALRSELIHDGSPIRLSMVHLPAVNTPQFDWARCKVERQPRPVAPVFEPEAVAAQIYKGCLTAPRELWIGRPTVKTIIGGLLVPALADRLAASQAYEGQMDRIPHNPSRKDNLFEPVDLDVAARGRFAGESLPAVGAISGTAARVLIAGVGIAAVTALAVARRQLRR
ncbi:SDR family oxidoreductase [Pseudorhizobium marinum]|uniref:SDR family oxidoreductase n=1 Tax=Pseudorhizobium marinum TaxID=1496690 RepID=UPI0005643CFB|nr:SDR family oxidoreductase [Pseudorhizobium marinum]MDY6961488.1 SDR family oxidoreductase [Pseudomonadota bacterium]